MSIRRELLFLGLLATFIGISQGAAGQSRTGGSITVDDFERRLEQELVAGLSRSAAEELLTSWNVAYEFVPREEFSHSTTIIKPPDDSVGALMGSTRTLEKRWIFERFVMINVFIGHDSKVSKVAHIALTAGP